MGMRRKKLFLLLSSSLFVNFIFYHIVLAEIKPNVGPPKDAKEAQEMGENAAKSLPDSLKEAWQAAVNFQKGLFGNIKWFWERYIGPNINNLGLKVKDFINGEIENRPKVIKEEFEKEKIEMKEEIQKESDSAKKSIIEKFKELINNSL